MSPTFFMLTFAVFLTLGCQVASQNATSPPVFTATPASMPTQTATLDLTLPPDISKAVLTLDDLPSGFAAYSLDDLGITLEDFSSENFRPENVFVFINVQDFQMIFGFNFLLIEKFDRASFDMGVSQPEMTLPAFVEGMGSENVRDEKILEGIEEIGEVQIGMTMIADLEDLSMQVDVLMFRRDVIGAMLISMTPEGQTPKISVSDLGIKLDKHLQETLRDLR